MTDLVFYLLVFFVVGVVFLFIHMLMGKAIRPNRPDAEKMTIYECGEPTVGSAWIQFDLRYYVVALLFVVFDVEVAFFFPWAVVFGKANDLSRPDNTNRAVLTKELVPAELNLAFFEADPKKVVSRTEPLGPKNTPPGPSGGESSGSTASATRPTPVDVKEIDAATAKSWAWIAFFDILVFFGVLMVGFAYLWKRGDIDWVRSTAAETES